MSLIGNSDSEFSPRNYNARIFEILNEILISTQSFKEFWKSLPEGFRLKIMLLHGCHVSHRFTGPWKWSISECTCENAELFCEANAEISWSLMCWCRNNYVPGQIYNKCSCGIEIDCKTQNSTSPFLLLLCFRQGRFWCTPWAGRKLQFVFRAFALKSFCPSPAPFPPSHCCICSKIRSLKVSDGILFSPWCATYQQPAPCLEPDLQLLSIFEVLKKKKKKVLWWSSACKDFKGM